MTRWASQPGPSDRDLMITHILCDEIDPDEPNSKQILDASIRMVLAVLLRMPEIESSDDDLEKACLRIVELNRQEWRE